MKLIEDSLAIILDEILTKYAYSNSKGDLIEARGHLSDYVRLVSSPVLLRQLLPETETKLLKKELKKLKIINQELTFLNREIALQAA